MPRDVNGNYTLPAGNPVVTETLVTSTWANTTMTDLANEMTDSLSRSGKGGFTAPVSIVDKNLSVPGLNFAQEPTSGFKREATEDVRIQVTATDVLRCFKTGVEILSGGSLKTPAMERPPEVIMRGNGGLTRMYFYNSTVPPGWTLFPLDGNIRQVVVGPDGGFVGGTQDPLNPGGTVNTTVTVSTVNVSGVTDLHWLTESQIPAHTHRFGGVNLQAGSSGTYSGTGVQHVTGSTGGGQGHQHNVTNLTGTGSGTGTGSWSYNPRYIQGQLGELTS